MGEEGVWFPRKVERFSRENYERVNDCGGGFCSGLVSVDAIRVRGGDLFCCTQRHTLFDLFATIL